jgi:hypothetical protein
MHHATDMCGRAELNLHTFLLITLQIMCTSLEYTCTFLFILGSRLEKTTKLSALDVTTIYRRKWKSMHTAIELKEEKERFFNKQVNDP